MTTGLPLPHMQSTFIGAGPFFEGGRLDHCTGVGRVRLGNIFCIGANTTSDLGRGGVEHTELHITFWFIYTKASFASVLGHLACGFVPSFRVIKIWSPIPKECNLVLKC